MSATLAGAIAFVWLGMVLAISFLEAPLKFRAPGITIPLGLGIGRVVFRALNTVEVIFGVVLLLALVIGRPGGGATAAIAVVVMILLIQLLLVRPRLTRRSDAVLAGADGSGRSHAHLAYIGLELIKVIALTLGGVALLASL